jgi:hypothetical protein
MPGYVRSTRARTGGGQPINFIDVGHYYPESDVRHSRRTSISGHWFFVFSGLLAPEVRDELFWGRTLNPLAAVDVNLGPTDVHRLVGAQEVQQVRDLIRFTQPAQGNFALHDFLGAGRQDRGVDLAW